MKKVKVAHILGLTTRQHVDLVLSGKRNFSYVTAKKAVLVIGGNLDIWMEKGNAKLRKRLWKDFIKKIDGPLSKSSVVGKRVSA